MHTEKPTILIIFGATGDLANRYLLPAVEAIRKRDMLPEKFELVGITRRDNQNNPTLYRMDVGDKKEYEKLNEHLLGIEKSFGEPAQWLFYLSVPPQASLAIIEHIGTSSLTTHKENKILLEKPFGENLENAEELVKRINAHFPSEQIYRVDHYLAKERSKAMLSLRSGDKYNETWNKDFIKSIEIVASEKSGIEGRADFYEQTGALRDFLQNHLLELAALTLMELPKENKDNAPQLRYEALKNLHIVCDITKSECVKHAQYEGYRDEVGHRESITETFVSLNLQSSDPKWKGVPITLTTGKELEKKFTRIKIDHKDGQIDFDFAEKEDSMGAYGYVLMNAMQGNHTSFVSSKEVLETWRIIALVQESWKNSKEDIVIYKKGSSVEEVVRLFL